MNKAHALLFCALLIPAVALAQESDSQPKAEDSGQQATSENTQSDAMQKNQSDASQGNKMKQSASDESSAGTAQDESMSKQDSAKKDAAGASSNAAFMHEQGSDQVRSDQLVGSDVVNASNEKIGAIDDLLLNKEGKVVGIIVGVGGFLGIGEKHVALAWDSVDITRGENDEGYQVKTSIDKAALEEAEGFKTEEKQQAEETQQQQQQQVEQQQQQAEQQQQQGQEEQQQ